MKSPSTIYYLEITRSVAANSTVTAIDGIDLRQVERTDPELNLALYQAVGAQWNWIDRLNWSRRRWLDYLDRIEQETWVLYSNDTAAGYFELELQPEGRIELVYFGLLPTYIGRGLGGHLLSLALQRAWQLNARHVWLHTCTEDHPGALANYQGKGFRLFKQETVWIETAVAEPTAHEPPTDRP